MELVIKREDFKNNVLDVAAMLRKAGFDLSGAKAINKEVTGDVIKYTQVE